MRDALRDRRFRRLLIGLTASMVGDSVLLLSLAIWAKTLTGSSAAAGLTLLTMTAPSLFAPLLGWVVDRFRRRRLLIVVNLGSACALCPLFLVRDGSRIWLLYAVGVLYGVSFIVLDAGLAGLLQAMLPGPALASANGLLATIKQGLRLAGPLLGAALFVAIGPAPLVTIDALSFVVAALALVPLRIPEQAGPLGRTRFRTAVAAGARYAFADPALRRLLLAVATVASVFGALETLGFAYVDQGLHRPPSFLGVLVTVQGIGGLACGLVATRAIRRLGELATVALGVLLLGIGLLLLLYPLVWLGLVAMPLLGLGLPMAVVAAGTLQQRRTPPDLIGRVWTVADALISTPWALSIAASAVLVSIVDYRWLLAGIAAILVTVAVSLWPARRLSPPEVVHRLPEGRVENVTAG